MKKRLFINFFVFCLLFTALAPAARAEETAKTTEAVVTERAEDECGDSLKWTMEGTTLYLVGSGAMDDYESSYDAPWFAYRDVITEIVVTGSATTIGTHAFENYDNLTAIDFGGSLVEIGEQAFKGCDGLTSIHMPATFRRFGPSSFEGCSNLAEVYCAGSMPSFKYNCLWNGRNITVYCPADNLWIAQYVEELETNFGGRLQVLADDGTDPFDFSAEEETVPVTTKPAETEPEQTTEAATEPTVEETTQAAEESTEATVEETTEPETETEEITEEMLPVVENEIESKGSKVLVGILAVVGILTLGLAVVMILRMRRDRDEYDD